MGPGFIGGPPITTYIYRYIYWGYSLLAIPCWLHDIEATWVGPMAGEPAQPHMRDPGAGFGTKGSISYTKVINSYKEG